VAGCIPLWHNSIWLVETIRFSESYRRLAVIVDDVAAESALYRSFIQHEKSFDRIFYFHIDRATVGVIMSRLNKLAATIKPLILGIQSLPSVCWVPFAILWFGLTENSILFVVVMGSTFCISIAVESAIRNVSPLFIKAARTMGAKGTVLYLRVILPAGLPALITGLKQGWSFAWRALMAAEVMSATIGLGQTLMMGRDLADINRVMLVILIIILIGVVIEKFVFSAVEERILKRIGL